MLSKRNNITIGRYEMLHFLALAFHEQLLIEGDLLLVQFRLVFHTHRRNGLNCGAAIFLFEK